MEFLEALGLKASVIVAGFVGGIVSLSMLGNLTFLSAMTTIVGGTACAAYLTPIVLEYTNFTSSTEHALAFFLGVCGMNGVAGVFKISERFRATPVKTLQNFSVVPSEENKNE